MVKSSKLNKGGVDFFIFANFIQTCFMDEP